MDRIIGEWDKRYLYIITNLNWKITSIEVINSTNIISHSDKQALIIHFVLLKNAIQKGK